MLARIATGYYDNPAARTFFVVHDGVLAGMTRLFDLDDDTPMFDLRVDERFRGAGVGSATVRWLTAHLFTELPSIHRIEGSTRHDNQAMRRLFRRCGYVKEAHHRQAWPSTDGTIFDAVGYGILRRDWETGTVTTVVFNDEPEQATVMRTPGR
ncbi:GNAT family protein [Streptomyces sp. ID05-26A]|nr:GNAT family protein [Streptomyces sp. ID05-26A]